jgi:hypothetical protein
MEGDTLAFAQVMTIIIASIAGFAVIGLGCYAAWKRIGPPQKRVVVKGAVDESRMERLEAAVDAIAVEVERISESQRFTMTMLAERLPVPKTDRLAELPGLKRVNTPH